MISILLSIFILSAIILVITATVLLIMVIKDEFGRAKNE